MARVGRQDGRWGRYRHLSRLNQEIKVSSGFRLPWNQQFVDKDPTRRSDLRRFQTCGVDGTLRNSSANHHLEFLCVSVAADENGVLE